MQCDPVETLMRLWHEQLNSEESAITAVSGDATMLAFRPEEIASTDLSKLMAVGLATISTAFPNVTCEEQLTEIMKAQAKALLSVYNLGMRRGRGKINEHGETYPTKARELELEAFLATLQEKEEQPVES